MTDSQDWWPADFGHYGPLVHPHGVAQRRHLPHRRRPRRRRPRPAALRAAQQLARQRQPGQGAPAALADQAEVRPQDLLGRPASSSPATSRSRSMGFKTFGFGGGRADVWEPDQDVYWGAEKHLAGGDKRYSGERDLAEPVRRRADGPHLRQPGRARTASPIPLAAARDIRETFAPHGDERRRDGRADRGRPHLRQDPRRRRPGSYVGARARKARRSKSRASAGRAAYGTGNGGDAITSGLEVTWTTTPDASGTTTSSTTSSSYEWELTKSPAGAHQWKPKGTPAPTPSRTPTTLEAPRADHADHRSLAAVRSGLREDLATLHTSIRTQFADAFARAWFKLTHRDMGPRARYLGPEVPAEELIWQDPDPRGRPPADRRQGRRRPQEQAPRLGPVGLASWSRPRGRRRRRSVAPTSAAARTAPASASRRRRTGRSTSRPSWPRC